MTDDGGRIGLARSVGDSRPLRAATAGRRPCEGGNGLQIVIKGAACGLAWRRRPEGATAPGPTPSGSALNGGAMKLIPHHQDDKVRPPRIPITGRHVASRADPPLRREPEPPTALGGSRTLRGPRWRLASSRRLRAPAGRAGLPGHHGRDAGKRERHDNAPPASRASRSRWPGRRTRNRPPADAERIECVMTTERDRRCDAGAADNREPPPALGRRTLEVANLASTDMTVMGRHANGPRQARLFASPWPRPTNRAPRANRAPELVQRPSNCAAHPAPRRIPGVGPERCRRPGFPPKNRAAELDQGGTAALRSSLT